MNVSANGKTIVGLTKQLGVAWSEVKSSWNDPKSAEFEQRFLTELASSVDRAAPLFDDLEKVLNRVRTDCE
ncbi:MAG TPA: hypothetical protein VK633_09925 [Verrucomicrobiae bacterium]|nr:hypothetical protein [Verrucomicrobiae bacterium]